VDFALGGERRASAMAVLSGAMMADAVFNLVLRIHGRMGYTRELPIERSFSLARRPTATRRTPSRWANDTAYGLAGSVFSGDPDRALSVARRVRSGMLSVNGGFFYARDLPVGAYKQSGLGHECGVQGFEEFLETKAIAIGTA
jgi:hypothetical protein